jgi:hypothetical protein
MVRLGPGSDFGPFVWRRGFGRDPVGTAGTCADSPRGDSSPIL